VTATVWVNVALCLRNNSREKETGKETRLDETIREKLLSRFAAYLDSVQHEESAEATAEGSEEADLFSVFVELAGLRNEVRTESRLVKEALDQFRGVFDTLQSSHETLEQELKRARAEEHNRERALMKPLLLDIIDVRDRLTAGLKPPSEPPPPRWYQRIRSKPKDDAEMAWREGMRLTLRRIDRLLAERSIVAIETLGRPFDPRLAAAMSTVEDPAVADGVVLEEVRPGFLWQGEVLRSAEVIVARRAVRNGERT
jgi:molecular chaperone GrpE